MDYDYSEVIVEARTWATGAREDGWLTEQDMEVLDSVDARSPASLFSGGGHRPLVVAFFGGTGVGKSTLLNRLAGKEIARTGVIRPTSREVTVYLHHSLHIAHLPEDFPVDKVRVAQHHDDRRKDVMWVDMPDIDSTEQSNREIVQEWLPHLDVVVYVVSPERYRDDKGWRMLLSHGQRHAWLFVINQWDRGQPAQLEDFKNQILKAGFADPIVFRTACRTDPEEIVGEDFDLLHATIQSLADANTIRQLEVRDIQLRLSQLADSLRFCMGRFGSDGAYKGLKEHWARIWEANLLSLERGLEWPIRQLASSYVTGRMRLLGRVKPGLEEGEKAAKGNPVFGLWDDWTQTRVEDTLEQLVIEADAAGIPAAPLKPRLEAIKAEAKKLVLAQVEQSLRESLSNPGNVVHRFFLKFASICATLLPLAAIAWVSYLAFDSYYTSSLTGKPFLGVDFAIHSVLLIAVSWLLPYFIYRRLRPSSEKAAEKGIKKGLSIAFGALEAEVNGLLSEVGRQRKKWLDQGERVLQRCRIPQPEPSAPDNELLARMLLNARDSLLSTAGRKLS